MGRNIVRYIEGPRRTGYGKTKFRDVIINTGRLKLVPLGPRAVGLVEDELDAVVEELIAKRDTATRERLEQLKAARTPERGERKRKHGSAGRESARRSRRARGA